jgi:hypothetical protein
MFEKLFDHLVTKNTIASFSWRNDGMQVGFILGWNEDEILIAHVSAGGYYDGYVLRPTADLLHVTYGGKYEQKVQHLYNIKEQHHALSHTQSTALWEDILQFASQKKLIVTAECGDTAVTGYIKAWDSSSLELCVVDQFGAADGFACIDRYEIDLLAVDTDYEQDISLLSQHHVTI